VPYRITRELRDESAHENGGKAPVSPINVRKNKEHLHFLYVCFWAYSENCEKRL
jgi:hypothetical protein